MCDCLAAVQCRKDCDEGWVIDPFTECGECIPRELIEALYPEWASTEEIIQNIAAGVDAAAERPADGYYGICPASEHEGECPDGYWNELACQCFYEAMCYVGCPDGQIHDPTQFCGECIDQKLERSLYYPVWADVFDIEMAGFGPDFVPDCGELEGNASEGEQDSVDSWLQCPIRKAPADVCELGFYWNELTCSCHSLAQCLTHFCEEGQVSDPHSFCGCIDEEEYNSLFPAGTTKE